MKYAGIIYNDTSAAPGICLSFFTQGCPHHCPGCHNPETWDFDGGIEFTNDTLSNILTGLKANGVNRNLCIMGGEPMCDENLFLTYLVASTAKEKYPDIKIYIWTGYYYEQLIAHNNPRMKQILDLADVLVDGPYLASERDITLPLRGSRNQRIIRLDKTEKI